MEKRLLNLKEIIEGLEPKEKLSIQYGVGVFLDADFPVEADCVPFLVLGVHFGGGFYPTWFPCSISVNLEYKNFLYGNFHTKDAQFGTKLAYLGSEKIYKRDSGFHNITRWHTTNSGGWKRGFCFVGNKENKINERLILDYCKYVESFIVKGDFNFDSLFKDFINYETYKKECPEYVAVHGGIEVNIELRKALEGSGSNGEVAGAHVGGTDGQSESVRLPKSGRGVHPVEHRAAVLKTVTDLKPWWDELNASEEVYAKVRADILKRAGDFVKSDLFKYFVSLVENAPIEASKRFIFIVRDILEEMSSADFVNIFNNYESMSAGNLIMLFKDSTVPKDVFVYFILKCLKYVDADLSFDKELDSVSMFEISSVSSIVVTPYFDLGLELADNIFILLRDKLRPEGFHVEYALKFRSVGVVNKAINDNIFIASNTVYSTNIVISSVQKVVSRLDGIGAELSVGVEPVEFVANAIVLGFLVEVGDYLMKTVILKKELYIYDYLQSFYENGMPEITDEVRGKLEDVLSRFESSKSEELGFEFKLEDRQRDAVFYSPLPLIAVTGGAGSGKTTTVEAIQAGIKEISGYEDNDIAFLAPTGKAASRLSEVVGKKAYTIHSYFRITPGSKAVTGGDDKIAKCVIIDEASMIDIDLMYQICNKMNGVVKTLIFIGDIKQLPPVGVGKPFASLMSYVPTVALNVSKRASEKSLITRNANLVASGIGAISDGDDFAFHAVTKDSTSEAVVWICSDCIREGVHPDSIQVMTPVNKYDFGVESLNRLLKPIFNPTNYGEISLERGATDSAEVFTVGDRVIHTKNLPKEMRYILDEGGHYKESKDESFMGVMNGAVGTIEGIYDLQEFKEICKLPKGAGSNMMFVMVKYILGSEFFHILYTARVDGGMGKSFFLRGGTIKNLKHAFALTVHKLQGSQSEIAVFVTHKVGFSGFVSRNLIYTGITRASKKCIMVGDRDSVVLAAKTDSCDKTVCFTEFMRFK